MANPSTDSLFTVVHSPHTIAASPVMKFDSLELSLPAYNVAKQASTSGQTPTASVTSIHRSASSPAINNYFSSVVTNSTSNVSSSQTPSFGPVSHNALSTNTNSLSSSRRRGARVPALVINLQTNQSRLLCSGNGMDSIRVWDLDSERCINEFDITNGGKYSNIKSATPSSSGSATTTLFSEHFVTSMTSDHTDNMLYTGHADGSVRIFDLRLATHSAVTSVIRDPTQQCHSIKSVHLQRAGAYNGLIVTADAYGFVTVADPRFSTFHLCILHQCCCD